MPITINPDWLPLALYAVGAALLLTLLFNLPYVGRALRGLLSVAILAFCLFLLFQQAPFDPQLSRMRDAMGVDTMAVSGRELRIRMAPDGHFWARATINGVEGRMLVDSGATVTALSQQTAQRAGVESGAGLMPVILRTANGTVQAQTGTVERLEIGSIAARGLPVVVSPALGDVDVLGMNFLSRLQSWRVEGRTLILVPPQPEAPAAPG